MLQGCLGLCVLGSGLLLSSVVGDELCVCSLSVLETLLFFKGVFSLVKVTAHVGVSCVARERVRKNYGDFHGGLLALLQHARMLFHTRNLLVSESA